MVLLCPDEQSNGSLLLFPSVLGLPGYFVCWAVAVLVCLPLGIFLSSRTGYDWRVATVAFFGFAALVALGSKLLYLCEAALFPFDDYVPAEHRGWLHGFRIPGGIMLLALAGPIVSTSLRLPWREFGDRAVIVAPIGVMMLRVACFLNGCCFGNVSDLPWALSFPEGSAAFAYQAHLGWINPLLNVQSLPVQPLQLYFAGIQVVILAILVAASKRMPAGALQFMYFSLFFATTAALEPMRANYLTLNNIVVPVAAIASTACFVALAAEWNRIPERRRGTL